MRDLLKELCQVDGVAGEEGAIRELIASKAKAYADEMIVDNMGNLLVFKKGKRKNERNIMLCAHMDEVGLVALGATDKGFIKFASAGSVDPRVLPGERVRRGDVKGVIGFLPVHLETKKDRVPPVSELYIDIGAESKEEAESFIAPGDTIAFDSEFVEFGDFYKAKAIDDRIGCAVLLTILSNDLPVDTWFAFTVQEEVGMRGAYCASYAIEPDAALIVEGTTAADLPDIKGNKRVCIPGKGAVIPFMDKSAIGNKELFKSFTEICEARGIPWQTKTYIAGGTDAAAIQRTRSGAKTIGLSAAVRYIHTPSCVISKKDCEILPQAAFAFLGIF